MKHCLLVHESTLPAIPPGNPIRLLAIRRAPGHWSAYFLFRLWPDDAMAEVFHRHAKGDFEQP